MEQQERRYLEQVLRRVGGQVSAAYPLLGISRKGLYDKINKHAIDLDRLRLERGND